MLKDFFQRNIEVMNELRAEHFKTSEYLQKGKYKMKKKFFGKGKKHYDFDINSQQYFHQEIDDIMFEKSQVQQTFHNYLIKAIQQIPKFNYKQIDGIQKLERRKNPADIKALLAQHYRSQISMFKYKKYLTMLRLHNIGQIEDIDFFKTRIYLLDSQIQTAYNREIRLNCEDYFEQSFVQGCKPVPVSENGQPIYKYLDQEQCWFSNINRDDIIVYSRNYLYYDEVLKKQYWPKLYKLKYLVKNKGLDILFNVQDELQKQQKYWKQRNQREAKQMINLLEDELQKISPGNLIEKENINSFIFSIMGVSEGLSLSLPLYPAIYTELLAKYNSIIPSYFKSLIINSHEDLIHVLPKLNSFCTIIFKYQNCEILEGKKQVKLGLDEDINVKKQLYTMLEEMWVKKYIMINFDRYDYQLELHKKDWPLDTISEEQDRQNKHKKPITPDQSIKQLVLLLRSNDYNTFHKHMKKRSKNILRDAQTKYLNMQIMNKFMKKTSQQMTLDNLSELYRIKFNQDQPDFEPLLKPQALKLFNQILSDKIIINTTQIEILQTLCCIKIRQCRTSMLNILNGMRCYHRNICFDLRVLAGKQFQFVMDDNFLINSNKQIVQNFQKFVKDNHTQFSKISSSEMHEQFLLGSTYKKNMMYIKHGIKCQFYGDKNIPQIRVYNRRKLKNYLIYDIVLDNLEEIEQNIIIICTYYIQKYQKQITLKNIPQLIDRIQILKILFQLEQQYQWEKFKLIQTYYYIYQNITQPLHSYKVGKIIIQLIHKKAEVDFEEKHFLDCYHHIIGQIKEQIKVVQIWIQSMEKAEQKQNRNFHDSYAKLIQIPLTFRAYIYGDLQKKQKPTSLQRTNSLSSKISRSSKQPDKATRLADIRTKIKQELQQLSEQQEFDLQKYDEYMLKKDMDAIFDDMVQNEDKDMVPVSTGAIENVVVNPKFQGGPHPKINVLPSIEVTSQKNQRLLNFTDMLQWIANIRYLCQELQNQFSQKYGFCSQIYQLCAMKIITKMMYDVIISESFMPQQWLQFLTKDPYQEIVTKPMKYFNQVMSSALDPPSNVQMAIASTLEKHQEKIPHFNAIQFLDFHALNCLIRLKKPLNTISYKQLNLGVNFIQLLFLKHKICLLQLQRQNISQSYENLGKLSEIKVQKLSMQYTRSGQSEVFLATQEVKMYNVDISRNTIFNESIDQIRSFISCELADIELFKIVLDTTKIRLEDYIRMKAQLGNNYKNRILMTQRLISYDNKNIKMIRNRINSFISSQSSNVFKKNSFLHLKTKIKLLLEQKIKQISQLQLQQFIPEFKQKISIFCKNLLIQKIRKKLVLKCLNAYTNDLIQTVIKNKILLNINEIINNLRNLTICLPYISKLFINPTQNEKIDQKIFYDQKKQINNIIIDQNIFYQGKLKNNYYIYTKQQLLQQWDCQGDLQKYQNLRNLIFNNKDILENLQPPKNKDQLFKWIFNIEQNNITSYEKQALKYFLKTASCITGFSSLSEYMNKIIYNVSPSHNKFLELKQHYECLLTYLQNNILLISMQLDDDVFYSLQNIIKLKKNFQYNYPIKDYIAIQQSPSQSKQKLAQFYGYSINQIKIKQNIRIKVQSRRYMEKKEHWAVQDQIFDFILAKVQGKDLIRQSFLPLYEELKSIINMDKIIPYLSQKIENVYKLYHLALWQTYMKQQNETSNYDYYHYLFPMLQWLCKKAEIKLFKSSQDENCWVDIDDWINNDIIDENRFQQGIYNRKQKTMVNKIKPILLVCNTNMTNFINQLMNSARVVNWKDQEIIQRSYNSKFYQKGINLINKIGQQNRFRIFARIKYFYEKVNNFMLSKSPKLTSLEIEEYKSQYCSFLIENQSQIISTILIDDTVLFPIASKSFKNTYNKIKQINEVETFIIYDKLQQYKCEGKIQFSRTEMQLIGRNQGKHETQHNLIIREVISSKLAKQQFRYKLLKASIEAIKAQKFPKLEIKKIINSSLIPRVSLISSYSSPLVFDRKTYISQQYKLAFVQAFINRFRNKVSRVDLLSSGYGFVITVPDLEDCINFMNKLLFTFTEKQFKNRLETFSQFYQILMQAINMKNNIIQDQQCIIKHLKQKVRNILQAQYLGKVSKLLYEKTQMQNKIVEIEAHTNGLEGRVRKTVEAQYDKKITNLQKHNEELSRKFNQFKEILVILAKDTTKNNFLSVLNCFKDKLNDVLNKKIDFTVSINAAQTIIPTNENVKVHEIQQDYQQQNQNQILHYKTKDLQRCKLGQDIIHDPYYTTKLVNKMRLFNVFKMGCNRLKEEVQRIKKNKELIQLHKIQDNVIAQSQRQLLLRQQLTKSQQQLSKKCIQIQKLKHSYDSLENEKTKLRIVLTTKQKKIQQRERQLSQAKKKLEQIRMNLPSSTTINNKIQQTKQRIVDQLPKISALRQNHKSMIKKKIQNNQTTTNILDQNEGVLVNIYDKFELSNKDVPWRQKCEQLYVENKKLISELDKIQSGITTPTRQGYSLNLRQQKNHIYSLMQSPASNKNDKKRFANISFKYNVMKEGGVIQKN